MPITKYYTLAGPREKNDTRMCLVGQYSQANLLYCWELFGKSFSSMLMCGSCLQNLPIYQLALGYERARNSIPFSLNNCGVFCASPSFTVGCCGSEISLSGSA
jgi:hypothetical protein